jgi:hypothetical protein
MFEGQIYKESIIYQDPGKKDLNKKALKRGLLDDS